MPILICTNLYECRARSVRLHGVATSIRLENLFWNVLDDIARRDGMRVPQLCTKLYDELIEARGEVDNFASFLRVSCGRYLALQLSGGIPQNTSIPIAGLNAQRVLATERWPLPRLASLRVVPPGTHKARAA